VYKGSYSRTKLWIFGEKMFEGMTKQLSSFAKESRIKNQSRLFSRKECQDVGMRMKEELLEFIREQAPFSKVVPR
jgi:hypothetical protein